MLMMGALMDLLLGSWPLGTLSSQVIVIIIKKTNTKTIKNTNRNTNKKVLMMGELMDLLLGSWPLGKLFHSSHCNHHHKYKYKKYEYKYKHKYKQKSVNDGGADGAPVGLLATGQAFPL